MLKLIQFQLLVLLLALLNSACQCGGRENQDHGDYVVQVRAMDDNFYGRQRLVTCIGMLVSKNRVLTSAKCIRGVGAPSRVQYWISRGRTYLQQVNRSDIHTYYIRYERNLADNTHGLALITIDQKSVEKLKLRPVCLPESIFNLPMVDYKIVNPFQVLEYVGDIKVTDVKVKFCPREYIKLCYTGIKPQEGSPFVGDRHGAKHCGGRWMIYGLYSSQYDPWSEVECRKPLSDNDYFIRFDHDNELSKWFGQQLSQT